MDIFFFIQQFQYAHHLTQNIIMTHRQKIYNYMVVHHQDFRLLQCTYVCIGRQALPNGINDTKCGCCYFRNGFQSRNFSSHYCARIKIIFDMFLLCVKHCFKARLTLWYCDAEIIVLWLCSTRVIEVATTYQSCSKSIRKVFFYLSKNKLIQQRFQDVLAL